MERMRCSNNPRTEKIIDFLAKKSYYYITGRQGEPIKLSPKGRKLVQDDEPYKHVRSREEGIQKKPQED